MSKLSPSQVRVLGLILEGKTNAEIAQELGWKENSIKNYRQQIHEILEIHHTCRLINAEIRQKADDLIRLSTPVH